MLLNGQRGRYGFGCSVISDEVGNRTIQHIGQGESVNAVFTRYIDSHQSIIILHAQSVKYARSVYLAIENIWEGKPFQIPQKKQVNPIDHALITKYVGDYGENGFMHLTTSDGKLFIQPDGNPSKVEIIPSSDTTFYFDHQAVEWQIYLDSNGSVIGFGPLGQERHMMVRQN